MFGQTYSSIVSDNEIVGFLNWKLRAEIKYSEEPKGKPKQLFTLISKWDTLNFFPERKKGAKSYYSGDYVFNLPQNRWLDTIFSLKDKEFLYKQFNSQTVNIWQTSFENSKLVKPKKNMKPNFYFLSLPLFSSDKKYVIIKQLFYCGKLCAYNELRVYRRKTDESWEYVGSLNSTMS